MRCFHLTLPAFALTLGLVPACGDSTTKGDVADTTDTAADSQETADAGDTGDADPSDADDSDARPDDTQGADGSDTSDGSGGDTTVTPDPRYHFAIVDKPAAVDVTPDGAIALFWDSASVGGDAWLYGVEDGSLNLVTAVGDPLRDFPTGLSDDLRISALYGQPVQAGVWTGTAWERIVSPTAEGCGLDPEAPTFGDLGGAWDISADGLTVVGLFWDGCTTVAFAAVEGESGREIKLLDRLGERFPGASLDPVNRATVVSKNGTIAAGFAQTAIVDRWPAVWSVADKSGELLEAGETYPPDAPGEVLAASADGVFVGGTWNQRGFIWSKLGGLVDIGGLPELLPGEPTYVNAISADGKLAFGGSGGGFFGVSQAFVWSADKGVRRLRDLANAGGLNLPEDLVLSSVFAASDDGTVLVGTLVDASFQTRGFVLRMPRDAY